MPTSAKRPKKFVPEPYDYHQEIEVEIDSLTNLGVGVGRHDGGWVVFVPHTLPGEKVLTRIYRNHANYSDGDLVEILEPSPDRIEPKCRLFGQCGGCQYQNLSYESQLAWKQRQVAELLEKMAGISHPVDPVVPSPVQYGYRSKITPHFQKPKKGEMGPIGFLLQGRRQQIIDVTECPIASDSINQELTKVRQEAIANAAFYKKGATLLLRDSADGKVCTHNTDTCEEKVGDLTFSFQAGEFFQNNPHILPAFVDHARQEALGDGSVDYLVDCYCGSGLFGLSLARDFKEALGIEVSEAAIDWARRNAEANGIENCQFIAGDAAAIFAEVHFNPAKAAVIIDPPRKGSTPDFLNQLIDYRPARVVYISCNPATQIRDLELLKDHYEITRITPFDLFPQTRHLECVVTLQARS